MSFLPHILHRLGFGVILHRLGIGVILLAIAMPCLAAPATGSSHERLRGFRADYLMELDRIESRMLLLARDLPEETYAASAGSGDHTLAGCLTDTVASSRRALIGMHLLKIGSDEVRPTQKNLVVDELAASLAEVRRGIEATSDEALDLPIDYQGRRWTTRALFMAILTRQAEGLGHASAHADSLGHPPPWLREKRMSEAFDD